MLLQISCLSTTTLCRRRTIKQYYARIKLCNCYQKITEHSMIENSCDERNDL